MCAARRWGMWNGWKIIHQKAEKLIVKSLIRARDVELGEEVFIDGKIDSLRHGNETTGGYKNARWMSFIEVQLFLRFKLN